MRAEDFSDVVWRPTPETAQNCRLALFMAALGVTDFPELVRRADADPSWFWDAVIREQKLVFSKPYSRVLDLARGKPWPEWCVDGVTNVCLNALDRHLSGGLADKQAVVWEAEDGKVESLSYRELGREVFRLAASLSMLGFKRGDPIGLHMAMTPEAIAAFLAIARIGGIVLPLFSGFGAAAIEARLNDAGAVAVIASDGTWRRGQWLPMKSTLDAAAAKISTLRHIIVFRRGDGSAPMQAHRDLWASDINPTLGDVLEPVPAEHPLMIIYTSGTTGRPKGTVHTHCGFSAKMAFDMELCLDVGVDDRVLWMTDMGWLVGPMLAVGAMQAGATIILPEGTPDWPGSHLETRCRPPCYGAGHGPDRGSRADATRRRAGAPARSVNADASILNRRAVDARRVDVVLRTCLQGARADPQLFGWNGNWRRHRYRHDVASLETLLVRRAGTRHGRRYRR